MKPPTYNPFYWLGKLLYHLCLSTVGAFEAGWYDMRWKP